MILEGNNSYAGFWRRLLAHNIDLMPILFLFYGVSFFIPHTRYDYILIATIYFGYHIVFEASPMQATPGKKWTKIKVTDTNHNRPSILQSILRNFTKILSLLLFFGGFIAIIWEPRSRGLHDYIGGTLVLFEED